jgi:hypothetical protein
MGFLKSIKKGIKSVFKGIGKVFNKILKPFNKVLGEDVVKGLMVAASIVSIGQTLWATEAMKGAMAAGNAAAAGGQMGFTEVAKTFVSNIPDAISETLVAIKDKAGSFFSGESGGVSGADIGQADKAKLIAESGSEAVIEAGKEVASNAPPTATNGVMGGESGLATTAPEPGGLLQTKQATQLSESGQGFLDNLPSHIEDGAKLAPDRELTLLDKMKFHGGRTAKFIEDHKNTAMLGAYGAQGLLGAYQQKEYEEERKKEERRTARAWDDFRSYRSAG